MSGHTVLVVDDEPMVGELLVALLSGPAVAVTTVRTVEAALGVLGGGGVSLVILDHALGEGQDARSVLADARGRGLPVVVLTGYPAVASEYRKAGATFVVTKPFHVDQLVDLVGEMLAP